MKNDEVNMVRLESLFNEELDRIGYDGILGTTSFAAVHGELMPAQKNRLREICGSRLRNLIEKGSIICIGIAYTKQAIDSINIVVDGVVDRDKWNVYAREYQRINRHLNMIAERIAERFQGITVAATLGGLVEKVERVEEYYPLTVSHRVVAENAGLGWRGKNELTVNERHGCAIRFASIITEVPLPHGKKQGLKCGTCIACLEACTFLKNKDKLADFREDCLRFIRSLALVDEVCGKCIKSCLRQGVYKDRFRLRCA